MRAWCALVAVPAFLAASCSSGGGSSATVTPAPGVTTPAVTTPAPVASTPVASTPVASTPGVTQPSGTTPEATDFATAYPDLGPPTGDPIVLGLVNTEGTPGLDFPEMRRNIEGAVDYLNQHGGMGGRPIKLETCTAKGSPETSQACAQQVVGSKVEMVLLGLDLFPDYATYTAAKVPVVGVLPILPPDYTANALFLTGGNATIGAAMTAVARDHFHAKTVGIISSDNAGANASEAALTASLDVAGIAHTTVKGGDNETDAGYQGLMREVSKTKPDLLVSLYSDAGCIGTIRGRAALGIEIPVLTTGICSGSEVLKAVGDDAVGWVFIGVQTPETTPALAILQNIVSPVLGIEPSEVDASALGLGGLALFEIMSLATYADAMAASGQAVTGASMFDYIKGTRALKLWPNGGAVDCGLSAKYPAICSFTFPVAEYKAGGKVLTIPGLEAVSSVDYLP